MAAAANNTTEHLSEISLSPTYLVNPTFFSPSYADQFNNYLTLYSRVTFSRNHFVVEVQPEIRALTSTRPLNESMRAAVRPPSRLMSLSRKLSSTEKSESVLDLERLNFNYSLSSAQISLGRKPVSLGVLTTFPVWNKFTRPLMTEYGPLRIFSQDQVSIRIQRGQWLYQMLDIEEREPRNAARLSQLSWFGEGLELHLIGGEWWESGAVGTAAVLDWAGTSIRFEEISFSADGVQAGLGAERAFNEFYSGLIELLYLETGESKKEDYHLLSYSRFRPLLARAYGYARVEYKPSALWVLQAGILQNTSDRSQMWTGKIIYSAANDMELTLDLRLPTGAATAELSRDYVPTQVIAGGKLNF
jgi:hypothetical protein